MSRSFASVRPGPEAIPTIASAAVVRRPRKKMMKGLLGFCLKIPSFFYIFFIYIAIELSVADVRSVFMSLGSYHLTWVEVLYILATIMAMSELLRVSRPGIDNTKEAVFMLMVGILYLVVFVLGTAKVQVLSIFNNTEFLMLLLVSWAQVILAFMINARTLKRTIDYTGGEDA